MKLSFFNISKKETFTYKGEPKIYNDLNKSKTIVSFNGVAGKIITERIEEVCIIRFKISANLTVLSSISNEPFNYKHKIDEVLYYTNRKSYANDNIIYEEKDYIDLEEIIYSLIITDLPIQLHKKREAYPKGENFRVMSEEEYLQSKEDLEEIESPFDKLKDLDFEEDN